MIPNYEFWDEALGAGGYRAIQGRTLSRAFMQRCSTSERKKLAQDIARALVELHKFPAEQISVTLARAEDKEALRLNHFDQIFACEKPFTIEENAMIAEACAIVQEILTGGTYAPVLLHGDLHCDNIIVHEKGRSLAGLIDFSDAVLGPAVFDFIGLYRASPALAEDVQHHYAIAMGMNEQELRRDCRAVAVVIYARDVLMQRHESGIQAIRRLNRSGYVMRSLFESGWTGPMAT